MLEENWETQKKVILRKYFYVYLAYSLLTIFYMKMALVHDFTDDDGYPPLMTVFCLIVLALWARQFYVECKQAIGSGLKDYFCSVQNMFDVTGLLLVLFVIVMSGIRSDYVSIQAIRVIAAFASMFTLMKLFDWLRLFDQTAFYIMLIVVTLRDVRHFMLLLLLTLLMFGVPLLMLNANSAPGKELIDPAFGYWAFDLTYNQYLLALGEFGMDNFGDHPQAVLVYCFFILATFFSQLTMLNMLIAIMGDSYAKVVEDSAVNSTRAKLRFLGDLSSVLPQKDLKQKQNTHFFVIKPSSEEGEEEDGWGGTVSKLTAVISRQSNRLQKDIGGKVDRLQSSLEESAKKDLRQDRAIKSHIDKSVKTQVEKVKMEVAEVRADMKKMQRSMDLKLNMVLMAIKKDD